LDELIDARDFLVQGGFNLVVPEDLLVKVLDFEGPRVTVFVVAFGGVPVTGDFLVFRSGGRAGGGVPGAWAARWAMRPRS